MASQIDYILTTEIVRSLATNKEEEDVLYQHMVPPMLVGGFVSVTIVSVVLAEYLLDLFIKIIRKVIIC